MDKTLFNWKEQERPFLVMAPMAGITNSSFRRVVRKFGADIVFSEMISSDALYHNSSKTEDLISFYPEESPYIVQIFGNDPDILAKATEFICHEYAPQGIDINMGCPAPKISGHGRGSALLKDFDLALKITEAVRKATNLPLSVKLRLGWESFDIYDFLINLEKVGVDAITVHARTKKQGFSGSADWEAIREIKKSLKIPVIGNGDVRSVDSAKELLNVSSCDGIMIGRGALGNPWIFKSIKEGSDFEANIDEIEEVVLWHTDMNIEEFGEKRGIMEMRKFYGWYFRGFDRVSEVRKKLVRVETKEDVLQILSSFNSGNSVQKMIK